MNIFLWVLQILLALHTAIGAVWKFSHSAEQTMPTLKAIPQSAWLSMSVLELLDDLLAGCSCSLWVYRLRQIGSETVLEELKK